MFGFIVRLFGFLTRLFDKVRNLLFPKRSRLLELPAELRVEIYSFVLDPLRSPPSTYSGLLLTCKLIKSEIEFELEKATRQAIKEFFPSKIPPTQCLRATGFVLLTHICIDVPRVLLGTNQRPRLFPVVLLELRPVIALHLRHLSLLVWDHVESDQPLIQLWEYRKSGNLYGIRTTRAHMGPFAVRVTCLLCPEVCHQDKHSSENRQFCIKDHFTEDTEAEPLKVNVNAVSVIFKGLDSWHLYHRPYPVLHASPGQDRESLARHGWLLRHGANDEGDALDSPTPTSILWLRAKAARNSKGNCTVEEVGVSRGRAHQYKRSSEDYNYETCRLFPQANSETKSVSLGPTLSEGRETTEQS
ncbi:hypothetical protein OPT61_g3663 [Boeremia exigua]|uniref:Uncharacterized protein n=1 Tax=Boeremia exigua TaxID=749465 RepID=A0ACC2IH51_9PLEO|nr:hypothetical protein OPT61_g3663 [Boeremia exigua]